MFTPSLNGGKHLAAHHAIHRSIMKCEAEYTKSMLDSIILAGGGTCFKGKQIRFVFFRNVGYILSGQLRIDKTSFS